MPRVAAVFHDPGFDIVAAGERRETAYVDHAGEAGQRAANEKGSLLPITSQKIPRGEAAEQRRLHPIDYM